MKDLISQQFTDIIDNIAEYFPQHSCWQQLQQRYDREYETHTKPVDPRTRTALCLCCNMVELANNDTFCNNCLRFFNVHSSDIVIGKCDCGHVPRDNKVFLFTPYGKMQSLCSIECVRHLYHRIFGNLIGKLK